MVKQPTPETSEFTMSNEDFPALPGSQANPTGKSKWRSLGWGNSLLVNENLTLSAKAWMKGGNVSVAHIPKWFFSSSDKLQYFWFLLCSIFFLLGMGNILVKMMVTFKLLSKDCMPFYQYLLTERKSSRLFQMMASQIMKRSPTLHLALTLLQI